MALNLASFRCMCGSPEIPGVMHRADKPCYHIMDQSITTKDNADAPVDKGDTSFTWIARLKEEHWELDKKGMRLTQFINSDPKFNELSPRDQHLLIRQRLLMADYFSILSERIWRAEHPEQARAQDEATEVAGVKGTALYEDKQ